MTQSFKTKRLVESALMIALSTILSFIIIFRLPFGGSITACCMLPVILAAYRYGTKWGLVTAFAFSLIQGIQGIAEGTFSAASLGVENGVFNGGFFSGSPLLASFGIFLLDYIIAFTVLGFGGIFRNRIKNKQLSLVCGILVAGLFRYIAHVISGAIVYAVSDVLMCMLMGAGLSFLGVGVQPPTPEWGAIISGGRSFLFNAPWISIFPGVFLAVTGVGLSLLGDGLAKFFQVKGH